VRGGEAGVGGDGRAVAGFGSGGGSCRLQDVGCWWGGCGGGRGGDGCWLQRFEGEAEVVEDLGIVGRLRVEAGEQLERGGKIAAGEGLVGLLGEGGLGRRCGVGMGEVLRGEVGGEGSAEDCDEREALESDRAGLRCKDWRGVPREARSGLKSKARRVPGLLFKPSIAGGEPTWCRYRTPPPA